MGVDTRLNISQRWKVQDIRDVIENRLGYKTSITFHDFAPDFVSLTFGTEDLARKLSVFTNSTVGGLPCVTLSFRSNEQGHKILRSLAEVFGGMFQESDCDSDFVEIQPPDGEDGEFFLKSCLKKNPESGRDEKLLAQMLKDGAWK